MIIHIRFTDDDPDYRAGLSEDVKNGFPVVLIFGDGIETSDPWVNALDCVCDRKCVRGFIIDTKNDLKLFPISPEQVEAIRAPKVIIFKGGEVVFSGNPFENMKKVMHAVETI